MSKRADRHISEMQRVIALLRAEETEAAYDLLADAFHRDRGIYLCGNGGSASTASHLAVDLGRVFRDCGGRRIRVMSLTDNVPWLTAVSNDECFADCFADQLRNHLRPGDVLIGVSASGDSENVVRAFQYAREVDASRLALIGFDGGRLARLATHRIWVDSYDYGIVESVHLFVGHLLTDMLSRGESHVPQAVTTLDAAPKECPAAAVCGSLRLPGEAAFTDAVAVRWA